MRTSRIRASATSPVPHPRGRSASGQPESRSPSPRWPLGATPGEDGCRFLVWAPRAERVELILPDAGRTVSLEGLPGGYHGAFVEDVDPGARYLFRLTPPDGEPVERPDPASRSQPEGVHGPSRVTRREHDWRVDAWRAPSLEDLVLYELHVGTFTAEGTFDAAIGGLDALVDLGVNAVELMPVAQFPGGRNWGYDGVLPFAAQHSYGGVEGFRRLVDAAHERGLAVHLDVVYNHLGPEGNYLRDFGPYFTDRYHTPWGQALNFDGPASDEVRRYFIESALFWTRDCRVDGLRLDAVHAISDESAVPFLEELGEAVHAAGSRQGRGVVVVAESDANDPRAIRPRSLGGFGLDGQWSDDFHHALHALLTGERQGYYADFGRVEHLARAFEGGYAYRGQRSRYRRRRHGRPAADRPARQFVVCAQNHDQVGNRARGDRLAAIVDFESLKVAAAAVLLSPFVPLLFMGEEWGATRPFPYFVSHSDPDLVEAVRQGRRAEFAAFGWEGDVPDPQSEATFASAVLDGPGGGSAELRAFYRELIRVRRGLWDRRRPAAEQLGARALEPQRTLVVAGDEAALVLRFAGPGAGDAADALANADGTSGEVRLPLPQGVWRVALDSADEEWAGPGGGMPGRVRSDGDVPVRLPARCAVLLRRERDE